MPYTSFAVAGATGGDTPFSASMGLAIAKELLKKSVRVTVLARASSVRPSPGSSAALIAHLASM